MIDDLLYILLNYLEINKYYIPIIAYAFIGYLNESLNYIILFELL